MKGKHIGKKIIASVLMLAMICSNISVYAENQTEQVETEAQENIESIAEEAPSDEDTATSASQEEEQEPEVTEEDSAAPEEDSLLRPLSRLHLRKYQRQMMQRQSQKCRQNR